MEPHAVVIRPEVIGDGMIGNAFRLCFPNDPEVTFYAAGVSDSSAVDIRDFYRERTRLSDSIHPNRLLVYFSTCSIGDPSVSNMPYVQHKLDMENIVKTNERWLILRLPIVAGRSSNPHTLLNHLFQRISRRERIIVWEHARRNIVDVDDIVRITEWLINGGTVNKTINIAAPTDYSMGQIVMAFEEVLGKKAVVDWVNKGEQFLIDTPEIAQWSHCFNKNYLRNTLQKYYG